MSRSLPPHPNLDHLKKQAKELLRDLRQQNPTAKLADAQHALARDFGFASWPRLKLYVESLPPLTRPSVQNPFVGKWSANLSKSRRHPGNLFQSALLQFAVSGDVVTITDSVVDDSGREHQGQNTVVADGQEHPSEHGNGYILKVNWRSPQILETVATNDGQVVGWGTYQVSDNGQTLTISGDQQVIVLERTQHPNAR
jgi:hypothetical protein